jgi:hypothetical protein
MFGTKANLGVPPKATLDRSRAIMMDLEKHSILWKNKLNLFGMRLDLGTGSMNQSVGLLISLR